MRQDRQRAESAHVPLVMASGLAAMSGARPRVQGGRAPSVDARPAGGFYQLRRAVPWKTLLDGLVWIIRTVPPNDST